MRLYGPIKRLKAKGPWRLQDGATLGLSTRQGGSPPRIQLPSAMVDARRKGRAIALLVSSLRQDAHQLIDWGRVLARLYGRANGLVVELGVLGGLCAAILSLRRRSHSNMFGSNPCCWASRDPDFPDSTVERMESYYPKFGSWL